MNCKELPVEETEACIKEESEDVDCNCKHGEWGCPIHGMSINIEYAEIKKNAQNLGLPKELCIRPSSISGAGLGIWSLNEIPRHFIFQSSHNSVCQSEENEMYQDENYSARTIHWTDFIRSTEIQTQKNLLWFTYEKTDYFQTLKVIPASTELLTFKRKIKSVSKHQSSSSNIARLYERHFPDHIPPTEKKRFPTRQCVVCCRKRDNKGKKIRKETRVCCKECNVSLCAIPCFRIYHTMSKF